MAGLLSYQFIGTIFLILNFVKGQSPGCDFNQNVPAITWLNATLSFVNSKSCLNPPIPVHSHHFNTHGKKGLTLQIYTIGISAFPLEDQLHHIILRPSNRELPRVLAGTTYYVYSPNYPNFYAKGITCRWQATAPTNMFLRLYCGDVNLPASTGCTGDRLLISKTGDPLLTGADKYCGVGTIDTTSVGNKLSVGLVSTSTSSGGRFSCTLTAVSGTPPATCSCGWKKVNRIVGGTQTGVNEFPMMAGLHDVSLGIIFCGATIISDYYVATAAHCISGLSPANILVVIGEHNVKIGTETTATVRLKSQQFIIHPSYSLNGFDYDIALIKTQTKIIFSNLVGPACLPFKYSTSTFENNYMTVLGWGTTMLAGAASDYLQKVDLQVISQATCTSRMSTVITNRMMCTYTSGKDACQLDSGSPLLWTNPSNGRLYLTGIVGAGYGCASTRPGINARITQYISWITANTPGFTYCNM